MRGPSPGALAHVCSERANDAGGPPYSTAYSGRGILIPSMRPDKPSAQAIHAAGSMSLLPLDLHSVVIL